MKENYNYLYVLDYSDSSLHEIKLSEEDKKITAEEVLNKYGLHYSNCNWMYTEIPISAIITHIENND